MATKFSKVLVVATRLQDSAQFRLVKCDAFSAVFTLETCVFTCTRHFSSVSMVSLSLYLSTSLTPSLSLCLFVVQNRSVHVHIYTYTFCCTMVNDVRMCMCICRWIFLSCSVFFGLHFICFPSSIRRTEVRRRISSYHSDGIKYMKCSHFWYTQSISKKGDVRHSIHMHSTQKMRKWENAKGKATAKS